MKNLFNSFYIFSKFSLTFILLLCVFFLIYLLYTNYHNEDEQAKVQKDLEIELRKGINENSQYIRNISNDILQTKTALKNIEKIIRENSYNNSKIDLKKINENISLLNKNFDNLSSEFSQIKNDNFKNQKKNNSQLLSQSINEVVQLITIKYENSLNFDKELKYLETVLEKENIVILEKLSILKNNKYKGHSFLEDQFDKEVNLYLKNMINQKESLFNKILLPYMNLSPTSENSIVDEKILILKEIEFYIKNRNIDKAYDSIRKIDGYKDFFNVSSLEMKNYNNFIKEISRLSNV
ncbi:hypothetical protein OAZ15_05390 [Pelagibacteraceae bacterium]|nr:hypothetical protein [Pelagibacteraceae bacterium]